MWAEDGKKTGFCIRRGCPFQCFFVVVFPTHMSKGEKEREKNNKKMKSYSSAQVRLHLQNLHSSNSQEELAATQT